MSILPSGGMYTSPTFYHYNRQGRMSRRSSTFTGRAVRVPTSGSGEVIRKAKEEYGALNPVKKTINGKYMPRKRKVTRKRRARRRPFIPRTLTPLSKLIKVRATQYVLQNTHTAGAPDVMMVQQNSCDDPFTSWGSGQPLGYDQWKTLYKKAYVVGTKLKVEYHNSASHSMMVGMTPMPFSQGTTPLNDYEHYKEYRGTVSKLLSPDMDHIVLFSKVSTKKFHRIKDITDNDDYQIDLINETPPSKLGYIHVWTQPTSQTDSGGVVEVVLTVEYIVLLTDPIVPSRSVET